MAKRKNRSRAMVLAAKRRGVAPASAARGFGGDALPSADLPDNDRKIRFADDDDDADLDADEDPGKGLVDVPPPPSRSHPQSTKSVIELPRVSAPWFARTLRADAMTHFEDYYRRQRILPDESEWDSFLGHLRRPLPVTFRMSEMASHRHGVEEALSEGRDILRPSRPAHTDAGRPIPAPRRLDWCNGFQLGCDKMALKHGRDPALRHTQRWLVKHNSTGVLTRQAVDSMVPAAILRVEPHHRVLDMCASPGSKTTQLLEALCANGDDAGPSGCVVANDINPRRCYFLVRRCAALGAATRALAVTNHHAQWLPNAEVPLTPLATTSTSAAPGGALEWPPKDGAPTAGPALRERAEGGSLGRYPEGSFDRIICDVPCSGDGTLRKNPQIWSEWRPEFAMGLHGLQLRIAQRGVALLRVGGYMVYSTCSFNPVENEAVVAELVRRCGGALEIVDASDRVRDLRRRPGMSSWKVITMVDDDVVEYPTFEDSQADAVSVGLRRTFEKSMWPPKASGVTRLGKRIKGPPLERCMRLMPHDQDMGGFFATLLRKTAPLPGPSPRAAGVARAIANGSASSEPGPGAGGVPGGIPRAPQAHRYVRADPRVVAAIAEEWNMRPGWETELAPCLFARSEACRALTYLSPGVAERVVDAPGAARVKCVWGGVKVWERRGTASGERGARAESNPGVDFDDPAGMRIDGAFAYRLTSEGAAIAARFAGAKRRLTIPARDARQLLKKLWTDVPLKSLTPATQAAARGLAPGSILVEVRGGGGAGGGANGACPPLAVELTEDGTLRVEWRYRKGLEGAPQAAAAAILRRLDP